MLPSLPRTLIQHLFISHENPSKGPALALPVHSPVVACSVVAAWPWECRLSLSQLSFPHLL